jgi:RNA-splicing ligase RtcB
VPVTVVGEHDARTVDQLRRCAAYGSVAGAALCADGHLGYAQPVGGVLAYTDHVSVSGSATTSPAATWPSARTWAWPSWARSA